MLRFVRYVAAISTIAWAQTATITGVITDPDGGVVKDASIQAKNSATGAITRATSSATGEYRLELAAGNYEIAVPMPCCQYGSFSQANIAVQAAASSRLDIHLP